MKRPLDYRAAVFSSPGRVSRRQLEDLLKQTTEKDQVVLASLANYKHLLTQQVKRLHFCDPRSDLVALKATNRCLNKLKDRGLVTTLKRRIGGARAGSSSYVWALTHIGARLLELQSNIEGGVTRKRSYEPSSVFLQHALAVAEVGIRLTEFAVKDGLVFSKFQTEPDCWRSYTDADGAVSVLRPDLFAVTTIFAGDYEDHWFFEVDLATELPAAVVRKCRQYLAYLNSGEKQKRYGVFPLVVWIVPDERRRDSLLSHVANKLPESKGLFPVITMNRLRQTVLSGIDDE